MTTDYKALAEVFKDREIEEYLSATRFDRRETYSDWHQRTERADSLIRGDVSYVNPDGVKVSSDLLVMNLADQVPRDIARLASEAEPSYIAPAYGDTKKDDENAQLRSVIGRTYFEVNNFDRMRPQLVMDLAITGTYFVCVYIDEYSDYPKYMRIDPRGCYPDTFNGELLDLLVVQTLKRRVAQRMFPDVDFGVGEGHKPSEQIEVWDYYGPDFDVKALANMGGSGELIPGGLLPVGFWDHGLRSTPVGFGQLPSPDGAFRGIIDQVGPSLAAKSRLINLTIESAHEGVYSPWESKGITNPTAKPGPGTIYFHNPSAPESFMRRVGTAGFNPQVMALVQYLDAEERGQMGYPITRQGQINQSQGSASYVLATQGQLTSMVREVQRILTDTQECLAETAFEVDQKFLDFEKALVRSVQGRNTYVPSTDIQGHGRLTVSYGAGAGLDRINTDTRLQNFYATGTLSAETMLNQTDFVADGPTELERRENEELSRALLQRFAGDPSISTDFVAAVVEMKQKKGITLIEAYRRVNEEQQLAAQPELPPQVGAEALPEEAAVEGAPVAPVTPFTPPPRYQALSVARTEQ